jgi:hypothetical protein
MEGIDAGLSRCEELGIRYATEVCILLLMQSDMTTTHALPQTSLTEGLDATL